MTGLSQSAFLQALGWATLNSFWQMALLWCMFLVASNFFKLSSQKKYYLASASIVGGALWFFFTLVLYYYNAQVSYNFIFTQYLLSPLKSFTPFVLTAASITYLVLLLIPTYKLVDNWKAIQALRKTGLKKAEVQYKLFVKKIAGSLGIKKKCRYIFFRVRKIAANYWLFKTNHTAAYCLC